MSKKKWYHDSSLDHTSIDRFAEGEIPWSEACNWQGPFDTFSECKKDAIAYHQTDIDSAKSCIYDIRKMKAKGK